MAAIFLTSMPISSHILSVTKVIIPIPSRCSCLQERRLKILASFGHLFSLPILERSFNRLGSAVTKQFEVETESSKGHCSFFKVEGKFLFLFWLLFLLLEQEKQNWFIIRKSIADKSASVLQTSTEISDFFCMETSLYRCEISPSTTRRVLSLSIYW